MRAAATPLERKRANGSSVDLTRERLLDAAAQTFSSDGLRGATTREIARKAGVDEVTLFRHFKSKEQLLRAVLLRGLAAEVAIMDQHSSWKENLRESMEKYARHYYSHMEKKKGIARAFLAEAQVLPKSMPDHDCGCDPTRPGTPDSYSCGCPKGRDGPQRSER